MRVGEWLTFSRAENVKQDELRRALLLGLVERRQLIGDVNFRSAAGKHAGRKRDEHESFHERPHALPGRIMGRVG